MKRLVTFLALPLVVALLGAACGGDEPTDELSVDSVPAERIVSITPTGTEMLYAVGAGDLVVAVDEFSYYPEGTPVTDLSGWDPNIEA
ncbi:MAG: ABC transporter substrate-binding protein, partial [Acidimicrobiales bacterium]